MLDFFSSSDDATRRPAPGDSASLDAPFQCLLQAARAQSGVRWAALIATGTEGASSSPHVVATDGDETDWDAAASWVATLLNGSDRVVSSSATSPAVDAPLASVAAERVSGDDTSPLGTLALFHDAALPNADAAEQVLDAHREMATALLRQWRTLQQRQDRMEWLEAANDHLSNQQVVYQHVAARLEEVVWVSSPSNVLFVSPAYERVFGRSRDDLYENPLDFTEVILDDDLPRVREVYESVQMETPGFEPKKQLDVEYRIRHPERGLRVLRSRAFVVQAGGQPYLAGITTDVTEQRTREEALRSAYERLRSSVKHSPLANVEFDGEHRVLRWSSQAEHLFGLTREEAVGRTFYEMGLLYKDDISEIVDALEAWNPEEERGIVVRNRNLTADGDVIHCVWYNSAILDEAGEMTSVFSLVEDVTERVQYEAELVEARREAEEANRLKSAFLANLSHEIRTPLTAIIGFAELVREEEDSQFGEIIVNSAKHLLGTLESVLELARLQSDEVRLRYEATDVVDLARSTVDVVQPLAQDRGLTLTLHAPEAAAATLDPRAVRRVLTNLLSNAVKFTDEGGVAVEVETTTDDVFVRVSDTGIGIDAAEQDAIFEEFRQSEINYEQSRPGTGLGLSITRHLVDLHGGEISVESTMGEGSTFTVRLPRQPS